MDSIERDRPVIEVDSDVLTVAAFMQRRVAASRLVSVADGVAAISRLLWGRYQADAVQVLRLDIGAIAAEQTPIASSE